MSENKKSQRDLTAEIKKLSSKIQQLESQLDIPVNRASENSFINVLRDFPVMIMAFDEHGNILLWNRECEKITGYYQDKILNNPEALAGLFPDKLYRDNFIMNWINASGKDTCDIRILCANGKTRGISCYVIPGVSGVSGARKTVLGIDITSYQQMRDKILVDEKKYEELFDSIRSGIVVLEAQDNGRKFIFTDINPAAQELDDIKKENVIGKSVLEVFPGAEKFGIMDSFKRVWETGQPEIHPVGLYKDEKKEVWRESYIYKLNNGRIVSIYNDFSAAKQAEQKIKEQEQLYELLTCYSKDVIWVLTRDFKFKYISPSTKYILGYEPHEITGKSLRDITEPSFFKDSGRMLEEDAAAIKKNKYVPRRIEVKLKKKDGDYCWSEITSILILDDKGNPYEFIGTMRDISADKQAREELREREEEYRAIFESAMDAFLIFDTSGFIKEANSAACKLYGYTKKEMLRLSGRSIVSPDQYYKFEKFLKKTSGKEIFQEESIDVRKDGSCVNVEVRGSFFIYRAKPHCLAVIRDVTEKKKIEKAQNLANLGELVENIGHEMNNPLQVMLGRTELLLMNKPTQEELRASLGIIRDQCECARNIVKQMRVISTAGLEHFSIIDLNESLETVIGLMEHQFSLHDIDVRRKYYKGSLLMEVDEKKMRQVFFNLLKNAVDAIGNRGVITVTTRLKDNKFIIKIIDSGPGIREEHIKKVLEPFFTTKYDRTGLGLSICSSIIKAHNGQLEILNNRLGAGTVATIVLPTVGNKL